MHSVHDIIEIINSSFAGLKGKWQGVADLIQRDEVVMPVIAEKHAGIDDKEPIIAYHRLSTVTSALVRGSGYGRDAGNQRNVYLVSMIVFVNKKLAGKYPDEVLLYIQERMPTEIKLAPFQSIQITFTNANLDSGRVYAEEYSPKAPYRLHAHQYLMKINYQIDTTFARGCFKNC
jgi:hypothetical protein